MLRQPHLCILAYAATLGGLTDAVCGKHSGGPQNEHTIIAAQLSQPRLRRGKDQDVPLDPGHGGKSILASALVPGDLILSTTPSWGSKAIRDFTGGGPVSHTRLYVGNNTVIESEPRIGVAPNSLGAALAGDEYAVAFRVPSATNDQRKSATDFAMSQVGKSFNYVGAFTQALFRALGGTMAVNVGPGANRSYFCSELVVTSYANAGITLATIGDITPNGIAPMQWTADLEYVGHLKFTP